MSQVSFALNIFYGSLVKLYYVSSTGNELTPSLVNTAPVSLWWQLTLAAVAVDSARPGLVW